MLTLSTLYGGDNNEKLYWRVVALIPRKLAHTYSTTIQLIVQRGLEITGRSAESIAWKYFTMDFELAMKLGLQQCFYNFNINGGVVSIRGCSFHYTKAIYAKIAQLGLIDVYKDDSTKVKYFCRLLYALPHAPPNHILAVYDHIVNNYTPPGAVGCPAWDRFIEYFEQQWLTAECSFPIMDWNLFDRHDHWSNNKVEGNNRYFGEMQGSHPNLVRFINTVSVLYENKRTEERSHQLGIQPAVRRNFNISKVRQVNHMKDAYRNTAQGVDEAIELVIGVMRVSYEDVEIAVNDMIL